MKQKEITLRRIENWVVPFLGAFIILVTIIGLSNSNSSTLEMIDPSLGQNNRLNVWNYYLPNILPALAGIYLFFRMRIYVNERLLKNRSITKRDFLFLFELLLLCIALSLLMQSLDLKSQIELASDPYKSFGSRWILFLRSGYPFFIYLLLSLHKVMSISLFFGTYFLLRALFSEPHYFMDAKKWLITQKSELFNLSIISALPFLILVYPAIHDAPDLSTIFPYVVTYFYSVLALVIINFINITWVFPKSLRVSKSKKWMILLLLIFGSSIFAIALSSLAIRLQGISLAMSFQAERPISVFIYFGSLLTLSQIISIPYYFIRRKAIARNQSLMLQWEANKSELSLLKSQINPHFLFNSLNTVYGLALNEESPKTAHSVQQLSDMMRFMLHENTQEKIALEKEIAYLNNYIELQSLRLDQRENIKLEIEIDEACEGEIAPMLLIPFVENAFKHGISLQHPSWIKVKLTCNEKEVLLNVQNSVHLKKANPEEGKSGIGQENVRKRLSILYPQKHLFQIYESDESYEANLKIELI